MAGVVGSTSGRTVLSSSSLLGTFSGISSLSVLIIALAEVDRAGIEPETVARVGPRNAPEYP
jgi:hypothetical protein